MIHLEPMSEAEFTEYAEHGIRSFAESSPRFRGVPLEEAIRITHEEFHTKMVPQGLNTPGHFLWSIFNDQTRVGYLHLGVGHRPMAKEIFVWDFLIFEPFRRKGFARQAMVEAGKKLKELGYTRVGLNVFGDNEAAIQLYKSAGFRVTQVQMAREIE